MVEFGEKLRQLRKEKKLTQKELAALIGVKNSVISFYELGDRIPSPEVIRRLAIALHVSADYLLGIERNETVDISGLSSKDKLLIHSLIESLKEKKIK